ncbi:MAG: hypothetical protein M5U09_18515 [Gammaproteobacteria bacterium]|nr:hypothetical protein [Gammaproteobacteria bacterium]
MARLLLCLAMLVVVPPAHAQEPVRLGQCTIAGIDVTGQTVDEARNTLYEGLKDKLNFECVITDGVKQVKRRRQDLGIFLDLDRMIQRAVDGEATVPLLLYADPNAMQNSFERLADTFAYRGQGCQAVRLSGQGADPPGAVPAAGRCQGVGPADRQGDC